MGAPRKTFFALALLTGFLAAGNAQNSTTNGATMSLNLTSNAFNQGQPIPERYTYDKQDLSPDLKWTGVPATAKSLALICDDPDAPAGTWVHWVLCGVAASTTNLPAGLPKSPTLDSGAKQGINDYKKLGYGGPCPPPGKPHRYFFKLYALDNLPELKPGFTKADLLKAMDGHILAEGQLMGTYQRK